MPSSNWGRATLSYCNYLIIVLKTAVFIPNIAFFGAKIGIICHNTIIPYMVVGSKIPYASNNAFFRPKNAVIGLKIAPFLMF
jgi:hypothetical protein